MKEEPNQRRSTNQPIGDDLSRVQFPESLFGFEAPVAGAILSVLGKAGIDLGTYALSHLSQHGPFQVCVVDSQFLWQHHVIVFLAMNCSPHGIYIENLNVAHTYADTNTKGAGIRGISLKNPYKLTREESGFGTDPKSNDFPSDFFEPRAIPLHLPPGKSNYITLVIPEAAGKNTKGQNWGQAIFSLTHLKNGEQKDVEQNFGLRW